MADAKLITAGEAPKAAASGPVTEVTDSSFDSFVSGAGYALVDCWAPWCGPCRRMSPIVDGLADISKGEIRVGKLNTDDNQATAMRFNIASIPRLLIYKDGELVDTIVGLEPGLTPETLKKYVMEL
ncbi:MAG: thiol reductase thioredoxin [Candidatus Methanomethylophilaceae archaeon]|nr:thiol reductase thioredoxin [Candidatus Methanomethylophilaceae archaeon]MBP5395232.1 thiol reductase thioredoxin [Candidatus Methanomethylophilaceae archaeon]